MGGMLTAVEDHAWECMVALEGIMSHKQADRVLTTYSCTLALHSLTLRQAC